MKSIEANYDGLVGPTHNYGGLSLGNLASVSNTQSVSNPKQAAKQGLMKMKALADRGFVQGVIPPHERPHLPTLRRLGFSGSDQRVLEQAAQKAPQVFLACCSASSMWTANAATVSPSADTSDGRVHFSVANLNNKFHRSIEHETTFKLLQALFPDSNQFAHHRALPGTQAFGDEGAANHTRLCSEYAGEGVELFVYGRQAFNEEAPQPKRFPARQTLEASQAIARRHGLCENRTVFAQQHPDVIDQGVFHNDVIAVGNRRLLLYHEKAFFDPEQLLAEINEKMAGELVSVIVPSDKVSVRDAVETYLFNSQLLSLDDQNMLLVVPEECRSNERVAAYLESLLAEENPINELAVFDLKQSMRNGGGPACLRLRVAMTKQELGAVNAAALMNDALFQCLNQWIDQYYRDQLTVSDLADPQLLNESRAALDELTQILQLGSVYPFQQL